MRTAVYAGDDFFGHPTFKARQNYYCFVELLPYAFPPSERQDMASMLKRVITNIILEYMTLVNCIIRDKTWMVRLTVQFQASN
jgi:hypothetical protein